MKLYSWYVFLLCMPATILAQETIIDQPHETFLNKPFTLEFDDIENNDADDQVSPHALSEEDITLLIFDETELQTHKLQEEKPDETIITHEELKLLDHPEGVLQVTESQEKKPLIQINPEELFSTSLQNFILEKNILTQETFSSTKKAKSQGKLIAEYIKQIAATCAISIAQARNITQNYIQKKCQDLNLGISNVEKKSLKKLLQTL